MRRTEWRSFVDSIFRNVTLLSRGEPFLHSAFSFSRWHQAVSINIRALLIRWCSAASQRTRTNVSSPILSSYQKKDDIKSVNSLSLFSLTSTLQLMSIICIADLECFVQKSSDWSSLDKCIQNENLFKFSRQWNKPFLAHCHVVEIEFSTNTCNASTACNLCKKSFRDVNCLLCVCSQ